MNMFVNLCFLIVANAGEKPSFGAILKKFFAPESILDLITPLGRFLQALGPFAVTVYHAIRAAIKAATVVM